MTTIYRIYRYHLLGKDNDDSGINRYMPILHQILRITHHQLITMMDVGMCLPKGKMLGLDLCAHMNVSILTCVKINTVD